MKNALFCFMLTLPFLGQSQTSKEQLPPSISVVQLLGVEYEIKDISNPDNQRLLLIPYVELCSQRLVNDDREIYDPNSNYTIILYSDTKCQQNKH